MLFFTKFFLRLKKKKKIKICLKIEKKIQDLFFYQTDIKIMKFITLKGFGNVLNSSKMFWDR